jgi:hypothetical protein
MHEHKECDHVFEFCQHCDVVYCEKCTGEWKKEMVWKPLLPDPIRPVMIDRGAIKDFREYPVISSGHICPRAGS